MFPADKTNAKDNTTELLAHHINNLEDKVGVDDDANTDSLDFKVRNLPPQEKDLDMGGYAITDVKNPTNAQDVATKDYIDNATTPIYFSGSLGSELTGVKSITEIASNGITQSSGRLTAPSDGLYYVSARQLIHQASGVGAVYMHLRLNGTTQNYGWMVEILQGDIFVDGIVSMTKDQYIDIYFQENASTVWTGAHSRVSMFKLK